MLSLLAMLVVLAVTTQQILWGVVIIVALLYLWKRSNRRPKSPMR